MLDPDNALADEMRVYEQLDPARCWPHHLVTSNVTALEL